MPDPIKPQFLGALDALAKFPDAAVIVIDGAAAYEHAKGFFPANPVLGWDAEDVPHAGVLESRRIIVWPQPGGAGGARWMALRAALLPVVACLHMVEVRKPLASLTKQEAILTLRNPTAVRAVEIKREAPAAAPVASGEAPAAEVKPRKVNPMRPTWKELGLVLTGQGNPMPTLDNAVRVLERDPALQGQIWYDAFLGRVLHTWGVDRPAQWTDADDLRLTLYLQRDIGIGKMAKGTAADAAVTYARRETRNCAYDWLDSLSWDGFERLDMLATRGFGAEPGAYNAAVLRNMMLAMVKRVFEPGCKSDYMTILEGAQGIGKSQALGIIGGEWFAELHMTWENKDFFDALRGKMLLEIGEMHAFKQSDVDRIKGIVSCATDRYRASYGRHTEDYPRCCVFVGTTNRDDWNRDDTGARRFWPVKCGQIDHAWLREYREQLFAEAVAAIRDGAVHWEVPWSDAAAAQEERRAVDPWEEPLRTFAIGKSRLLMSEILAEGLKIEAGRQTLGDMQRAGRCMKAIGWKKIVPTEPGPGGKRGKVWVRDSADATTSKDLLAD